MEDDTELNSVIERIKKAGYEPFDIEGNDTQIGWSEIKQDYMLLVDDRNTAEQVVHSCISKGYGLQRAKQALYEKRIPKQYWGEVLQDYPDQTEKIEAFLHSRLDSDSDAKQIKRTSQPSVTASWAYSA